MVCVAVDIDGEENIGRSKDIFIREDGFWSSSDPYEDGLLTLPKGSIKKLIGRELTWENEPVELKETKISCRCGENTRQDAQCLICGQFAKEREDA